MKVDLEKLKETHPWITFTYDLNRLSHFAWMRLGECVSKCDHIASTPLSPDVSRGLHQVYLAKGVHATTAIEGNTLSEDEVRLRLENKLHLPPSKEYLQQEIDNIINACNVLIERIGEESPSEITPKILCEYNAFVMKDLPHEEHVILGEFRKVTVGVATYRAPNASCVPGLMDKLCQWLNGPDFKGKDKEMGTVLSIVQAIIAHLYLAWIHPFGDGNGRTARLLEFDLLLRAGFSLPSAHILSDYYNATRSEYYRQLDAASKTKDPTGFLEYAILGFRDGLRQQLSVINAHVRKTVWTNHVHDQFKGKRTETAERQRHIVLDLSDQQQSINYKEIPVLTPRLRKHYLGKGDRTLQRDLNILVGMKLIKPEGHGLYSPNTSLIDAFLPFRRKCDSSVEENQGH